ncbi:MAG: sulfite exporter TauE/SafE family protein [Solirubrobacteraceae bacterium]|nr:sulfite exporter TauE/SafE family protein [Solirubrobacteraceae bacterium]
MTLLEMIAVVLAGAGAGMINTVVGSGTLVTFPVLLSVGYPPIAANVANNIGLVPGSVSGVIGYRQELEGKWRRVGRLGVASLFGGITGAILLFALPPEAFETIVPVFIVIALVLIILQPRIGPWLAKRRPPTEHGGPALLAGVFVAGIYGGYFGAAQGILLMALLSISLADDLQTVNAFKNVLAGIVNGVAAIVFIIAVDVEWLPAGLIAVGAIVGAQLGARYGKQLSPTALRAVIVVVGIVAIVRLLAF